MKYIFAIILLIFVYGSSLSQQRIIGDSVKITFLREHNKIIIGKVSDLDFSIIISNLSSKPVRAYKTLWYSSMPSPLANYDCPLFKKEDTGFKLIDHYSHEPIYQYLLDSLRQIYSDVAADSIFKDFDFYKDSLGIGCSDTLHFNLLRNNIYLDAGEYRFKIAFRIGNDYEVVQNKKKRKEILYTWSDWYYFKLEDRITVPISNPN